MTLQHLTSFEPVVGTSATQDNPAHEVARPRLDKRPTKVAIPMIKYSKKIITLINDFHSRLPSASYVQLGVALARPSP